MSPAEAAAFLRRYNEWRRTDDRYGMPYPDPREIGKAIDAAVEMIDRLEAAEKERDVLKAKIERMEKRLRLILEEPENTMSNSKAMREMLRQARLALEETK